MSLRYYYNVLRGKTKALNPAKIDLPHIWAVVHSFLRGIYTPKHIREQIVWRRGQVILKSPKCWEEGACVDCGCIIISKTRANMECEAGCYPPIMNKKKWEHYKKLNNIRLFQ